MSSNAELEAAKKGIREALSIYQTSCGWELVDAIAVHALEAAEAVRAKARVEGQIRCAEDQSRMPVDRHADAPTANQNEVPK